MLSPVSASPDLTCLFNHVENQVTATLKTIHLVHIGSLPTQLDMNTVQERYSFLHFGREVDTQLESDVHTKMHLLNIVVIHYW